MPVVVARPPVQLGHTGRLLCAAPGRRAVRGAQRVVVLLMVAACHPTGFSSCRGHRAELLAMTVVVALRKDCCKVVIRPSRRRVENITCCGAAGAVMANAGSMVRRSCEHMQPGRSTLPLCQSAVLTPWPQPRARRSRLGERS